MDFPAETMMWKQKNFTITFSFYFFFYLHLFVTFIPEWRIQKLQEMLLDNFDLQEKQRIYCWVGYWWQSNQKFYERNCKLTSLKVTLKAKVDFVVLGQNSTIIYIILI